MFFCSAVCLLLGVFAVEPPLPNDELARQFIDATVGVPFQGTNPSLGERACDCHPLHFALAGPPVAYPPFGGSPRWRLVRPLEGNSYKKEHCDVADPYSFSAQAFVASRMGG